MNVLIKLKKKLAGVIAILFILSSLISCQVFNKDIRKMTLSLNEQQQVDALLENSPTRCVGVYLIDFPAVFDVNKEGFFYYKSNSEAIITTKQQYFPPYKQMIALREQELKNTNPNRVSDGDYLKAIYPVHSNNPDKMQGIIFERMESKGTADAARVLEGYRWQDGLTLKIEMKARNGLAKQYDENRLRNPQLYGNNVPQKLIELRQLFKRIQNRDDLTIPTTPGFCMLHGFMQGEDSEWKDMEFVYQHNDNEDFYFSLKLNDFAGDYALLDKPEVYVTEGEGHTIYKGTRESNGLLLEEWMAKGQFFWDEERDRQSEDWGYTFVLGVHMTDPTYKTPQLRIRMYYRIPEDETQGYTQDQLMVIWREITNSIKIRESSFD